MAPVRVLFLMNTGSFRIASTQQFASLLALGSASVPSALDFSAQGALVGPRQGSEQRQATTFASGLALGHCEKNWVSFVILIAVRAYSSSILH